MMKDIDKIQTEQIRELQKKIAARTSIEVGMAILGILILEIYALSQGIDGKVLAFAIAIIAGLGGYKLGIKKEAIKNILKSFQS